MRPESTAEKAEDQRKRYLAGKKKWRLANKESIRIARRSLAKRKLSESPWYRSYRSIQSRVTNKAHWYCRNGIKKFITMDDMKELWFRDRADLMKCPSIDRIDNKKHYTKDNCRYIELEDNFEPMQICKYSKRGVFLRKYKSIMEASRKLGVESGGISKCVNGVRKTAYGYCWKKADCIDAIAKAGGIDD